MTPEDLYELCQDAWENTHHHTLLDKEFMDELYKLMLKKAEEVWDATHSQG